MACGTPVYSDRMNYRTAACLLVASTWAQAALSAQGYFLPAGDSRLRDDLTLLVDEGVVNLPVNEWPLARQDVAEAVSHIDASDLGETALRNALARVIARTALPGRCRRVELREVRLTGGQPGLLRDEGTLGRENGELTSTGAVTTGRYNITIAATGVVDASDGQDLRFDGSDITIRWGNWLFSANQVGSLVGARP